MNGLTSGSGNDGVRINRIWSLYREQQIVRSLPQKLGFRSAPHVTARETRTTRGRGRYEYFVTTPTCIPDLELAPRSGHYTFRFTDRVPNSRSPTTTAITTMTVTATFHGQSNELSSHITARPTPNRHITASHQKFRFRRRGSMPDSPTGPIGGSGSFMGHLTFATFGQVYSQLLFPTGTQLLLGGTIRVW